MPSQQFVQSVLVPLVICTLAFHHIVLVIVGTKLCVMTCNMINAISIQNNLSSTSKLELEKPREQIDFWGLNFIFSLKMTNLTFPFTQKDKLQTST